MVSAGVLHRVGETDAPQPVRLGNLNYEDARVQTSARAGLLRDGLWPREAGIVDRRPGQRGRAGTRRFVGAGPGERDGVRSGRLRRRYSERSGPPGALGSIGNMLTLKRSKWAMARAARTVPSAARGQRTVARRRCPSARRHELVRGRSSSPGLPDRAAWKERRGGRAEARWGRPPIRRRRAAHCMAGIRQLLSVRPLSRHVCLMDIAGGDSIRAEAGGADAR
jgi:hypothetical protein